MTETPRSQEPLQRPRDSDPSEMTDFEKNTTTEELEKDPSPGSPPVASAQTRRRERGVVGPPGIEPGTP